MTASDTSIRLERERCYPLLVAFAAAFLIRLIWVSWIQVPGDGITSDMSGYISRGRTLLPGGPNIAPKNMVCYPYGAHTYYGLQQLVFGKGAYTVMAWFQAAASAVVVPASIAIAWRCGLGLSAGYLVGALIALWPPAISFAGYFSSETPYALFLITFTWAWLRWTQTGKGAWLAGCLGAIAFTIRPQLLVTFLLGLAWLWTLPGTRLTTRLRNSVPTLVFPMLIILAFSMTRYHAMTDGFGLISTNSTVGRFFADTEYRRLAAIPPEKAHRADEIKPNYFHPPARSPSNGFTGDFVFVGDTCQSPKIEAERRRFIADKSVGYRIGLIQRNTHLLFYRNNLWPERNYWDSHDWRRPLMEASAPLVQYLVVPLALLGFFGLIRRRNFGVEWLALHGFTMLFAAARYFGEVRYRVPYDPLFLILAAIAVHQLFRLRQPEAAPPRGYQLITGGLGLGLVLLFFGPWMSWP